MKQFGLGGGGVTFLFLFLKIKLNVGSFIVPENGSHRNQKKAFLLIYPAHSEIKQGRIFFNPNSVCNHMHICFKVILCILTQENTVGLTSELAMYR